MRVYISGPITGTADYKQRFEKAEKDLIAKGYEVINPVKVAEALPELTYHQYLTIDMALLSAAKAIYMLAGWQNSSGAIEEYKVAAGTHKEVLFETQEQKTLEKDIQRSSWDPFL